MNRACRVPAIGRLAAYFANRPWDQEVADRIMCDCVEEWHASPEGPSLWAWLGMSIDDYAAWVSNPRVLQVIAGV